MSGVRAVAAMAALTLSVVFQPVYLAYAGKVSTPATVEVVSAPDDPVRAATSHLREVVESSWSRRDSSIIPLSRNPPQVFASGR